MKPGPDSAVDLLAFAPHPDDAELFCGGLLLKMSEAGHRTAIVDMSRGELSSRGSVDQREKEAKAAALVLGLSWRENLFLPDGGIGQDSLSKNPDLINSQLAQVVQCIRRLRPSIILCPYPSDRHPDHVAASKLVADAVFFAGLWKFQPQEFAPFTPAQLLYYQLRVAFKPSFVSDTSKVHEKKLAAIRCYESQISPVLAEENQGTVPLISSSLSLASISARDSYYGSMIGTAFGEPYFTKNILAIEDPLKHFGQAMRNSPLLFPSE